MLGKAQLSRKNEWFDEQGRVYFIYPVQQMAIDMDKSETTIKTVVNELVEAKLLEKIPEGIYELTITDEKGILAGEFIYEN